MKVKLKAFGPRIIFTINEQPKKESKLDLGSSPSELMNVTILDWGTNLDTGAEFKSIGTKGLMSAKANFSKIEEGVYIAERSSVLCYELE